MFGYQKKKTKSSPRKLRSGSRRLDLEQLNARLLLTVTTVDNVVTVDASEADNQIEVVMGAEQHTLSLDGEMHEFDASVVDRILIYGNDGQDTVTVQGTAADERVESYDRSTELLSANYIVRAEGVETIEINTGDGSDWVELVDSAGNDVVDLAYDRASISRGDGRSVVVTGHEETEAFASLGGNDTVNFTDSPNSDRFFAKYLRSFMLGDGFSTYARGFEAVNAESSAGGDDEARMHDSPADDTLTVAGRMVTYEVEFATHTAKNFGTTKSYSTEGNDSAAAFGAHFVTDIFVWESESAYMYTTGVYDSTAPPLFVGEETDSNVNVMIGFPKIEASGSDPSDRADLRGTSADDSFVGLPNKGLLVTPDAQVEANSFGITRAFGNGGDDVAYLEDSDGNDEYVGRSTFSYLEGADYLNYVSRFQVDAVAKNGGFDNVELWDYSGPGRDYLVLDGEQFVLYGPERNERIVGFDHARTTGDNAGLAVEEESAVPVVLAGSHSQADEASESVAAAYRARLDGSLPEYEVVDGDIQLVDDDPSDDGDDVDPVDDGGDDLDPTDGEVTDPTDGEVTDPTDGEVTDPTDGEVTDPTDGGETDPSDIVDDAIDTVIDEITDAVTSRRPR